jgi:hypothetical protein
MMGSKEESRRSILERHQNAITTLEDALKILEGIEPKGDSLRALIVQFLGASRDLERHSRMVGPTVESDPSQADKSKTIKQSLLEFWTSGRKAIDEANASFATGSRDLWRFEQHGDGTFAGYSRTHANRDD